MAVFRKKEMYILYRPKENNRYLRSRPVNNAKGAPIQLNSSASRKMNFSVIAGAYGNEWARRHKGNQLAKPNTREVLEGLMRWLVE